MLRSDFDQIIKPFAEALQVKMTRQQAEYYWLEYQNFDKRDFATACQQLGMGTPGRLPTASFFRDNIVAAMEMRIEREKGQDKRSVRYMLERGPTHEHPMEALFAKCCGAICWHDPVKASMFIRESLKNADFLKWCTEWRTKDGEMANVFLLRHCERIEGKDKATWKEAM